VFIVLTACHRSFPSSCLIDQAPQLEKEEEKIETFVVVVTNWYYSLVNPVAANFNLKCLVQAFLLTVHQELLYKNL
jgi:hypothetical protein